jgi:hypothetical protein
MATAIYVLCRSEEPITYGELEEVMGHMGWLERPARFDPPPDDKNRNDAAWDSFEVEYDPKKRPVIVRHCVTDEEMKPHLNDVRDLFDGADESEQLKELRARVDETKQLVLFEIPGDPPQDVWMMCDQGEAFVARERDGMIVSDEGVWDGEMNQLLAFGDT